MKYEVAEETGMRLVLNTENAGYIELAEVINDSISVKPQRETLTHL